MLGDLLASIAFPSQVKIPWAIASATTTGAQLSPALPSTAAL